MPLDIEDIQALRTMIHYFLQTEEDIKDRYILKYLQEKFDGCIDDDKQFDSPL